MATSGLPGISVGLSLDSAQFDQRLRQSGQEMAKAGQGFQRTAGMMRGAFANVGNQIQDLAVQIGGGTSALRAMAQQLPQLASGFGPVGIAVGTLSALTLSLGAAFLGMRDNATETAKALSGMKVSLDQSVMSVDEAIKKYRELTAAQRANLELNLTAGLQESTAAFRSLNSQMDENVATIDRWQELAQRFGGGTEGAAELTRLIAQYQTGLSTAGEFASGLVALQEVVGDGDATFAGYVESVRELANNVLKADLQSDEYKNSLKALDEIAAGNTKTHEEVAKAADKQTKAHERAAKEAEKLTGANKRLADAGKFLTTTSAQEERASVALEKGEKDRAWRREEALRMTKAAHEGVAARMLREQETMAKAIEGIYAGPALDFEDQEATVAMLGEILA